MTPFQAGRVKAQNINFDEPNTKSREELAQFTSSELDGLYAPGREEGKSPRSLEQLQISRDYHWGILQGLKDIR